MPPHILVVGSAGLLGRHLVALGVPGVGRADGDVTDPAARERILDRHRPDAVLFCAALADVDRCEADPAARAVNAEAPAAWARRVPLWLVSTNYVFSGPGPHRPGEEPAPVQAYGRQKAEAEAAVRAAGGHVVRTAWLFGAGGRSMPSRLPALLRAGPVRCVADVPVQPTWAGDVAERLVALPEGITHAVGSGETTWAAFARALAVLLGLPGDRVVEVPEAALGRPARRPDDARLAPALLPPWTDRLEALVPPLPIPR